MIKKNIHNIKLLNTEAVKKHAFFRVKLNSVYPLGKKRHIKEPSSSSSSCGYRQRKFISSCYPAFESKLEVEWEIFLENGTIKDSVYENLKRK